MVADALAARIGPIFSNPVAGEWGVKLVDFGDSTAEYARGIGVFRAGHAGIAEHIHSAYAEHFEVLEGAFLFKRGKEEHRLGAGERIVVPKGVVHAFRYVGEGFGSFIIETRPAGRFTEFIPIFYGLGHEGKLTKDGAPKLLQAVVMARALANDTIFLSPPPVIMRPLIWILGPVARLLGYQAANERYGSDEFWEQRVEQP